MGTDPTGHGYCEKRSPSDHSYCQDHANHDRMQFRDSVKYLTFYEEDGQVVPKRLVSSAYRKYEELLQELEERSDHSPMRLTVAQAVRDAIDDMEVNDMERRIIEALCSDLYVAEMDALSLKGMVSFGYTGPHELVIGGFG